MGAHLIKDKIIYINDMINLVLENINYGSVWKSIRLVSKNIYVLSIKYQRSKLIELGNPILSLIYIYPEKSWDLWNLLDVGIITIDFIKLSHDRISWDKEMISMSSGITIDDILKSDSDSIDWKVLSKNPSIKVSDMLRYSYLPWNYYTASANTSIRIEDIRDNISINWNYNSLAINNSLSIEDLSTIMDLKADYSWQYNSNTTYEDIIKYGTRFTHEYLIEHFLLDENTLQAYLDIHPNNHKYNIFRNSITPNIIKNNPNIYWGHLGINYSKFTVEEVIDIPGINGLDVYRILRHPDFTIDDFFKYFNVNTFDKWYYLSGSPWLTFDIVLEYKNTISWDHPGLSMNPNVTVDILEDSDFSWIEWDYFYLSNRQLNFVYIIEHIDINWDFDSFI